MMRRMLLVVGLTMAWSAPSASAASTKALSRQARVVHIGQIHARGLRGKSRAEVKTSKLYNKLVKMLRHRSQRKRRTAGTILVALVSQASVPGQSSGLRLYPRLNTRNHNRYNAACEKNLRRLLGLAAQLARGTRHERTVASRMVKVARTLEYGALVALTRAQWRLGDRDNARWAATQAILNFPPADKLVRHPNARLNRINRRDAATIVKVLWVMRTGRTAWHAFRDLRREDSKYDGRSAVPRLQAIGYLASRTKGWLSKRVCRELKRWESVANFRLVARKNDRWVPARGIARVSAMGLGHLQEAPIKLARRR